MKKEKLYTVYKITNNINNMIYVGVHITTNINDGYMGSGTNIKKIINECGKHNFKKEILFIFNNKEEMLAKESEIVNSEFTSRNDTYNIILGGGFLTNNCIVVKDNNGNSFMTNIKDPRYISGELIHICKNMITAKDKNGKIHYINKNDPRWLNGELVGTSKDKIKVKDKNGKILRIHKNDPNILNGELIPIKKQKNIIKKDINKIKVMDMNGIFYVLDKNDPKFLNGELFKCKKGYLRVKDINNNKFYLPKNDQRILNGELIRLRYKWKLSKPPKKSTFGLNNSIGGKIGLTNKQLGKRKYVTNDELEYYLSIGWTKGWQ